MTASESPSVNLPALEVRGVQLDREDLVGADRSAHGSGDFEQEPATALGVAAPVVATAVGVGEKTG